MSNLYTVEPLIFDLGITDLLNYEFFLLKFGSQLVLKIVRNTTLTTAEGFLRPAGLDRDCYRRYTRRDLSFSVRTKYVLY